MQREKLEAMITELVLPMLVGTELELVDVEYVREREWYLRIFINKPGGIEIDDCQFVSERLTKILDEKDPIKDKYYLEVSSPGIDRPLKKDKDYERAYGTKVDIMLFAPLNGKKTLEAVLVTHNEEKLTLLLDDNKIELERKLIANIRPHLDF
ncbi:MAG: ribosome maturation factor RimP [Acidaminococcaceae bacterium]